MSGFEAAFPPSNEGRQGQENPERLQQLLRTRMLRERLLAQAKQQQIQVVRPAPQSQQQQQQQHQQQQPQQHKRRRGRGRHGNHGDPQEDREYDAPSLGARMPVQHQTLGFADAYSDRSVPVSISLSGAGGPRDRDGDGQPARKQIRVSDRSEASQQQQQAQQRQEQRLRNIERRKAQKLARRATKSVIVEVDRAAWELKDDEEWQARKAERASSPSGAGLGKRRRPEEDVEEDNGVLSDGDQNSSDGDDPGSALDGVASRETGGDDDRPSSAVGGW